MAADSYADLIERLFVSFEHRHTFSVIETIATQCQVELAGQTSLGAEYELLERLARHRLAELAPTRPRPPGREGAWASDQ